MFLMLRQIYKTRLAQDRRIRIKRYLAHNFRGTQSFVFGALFGSDLTALAVCYGTDKAEYHHYTDIYMPLFSLLRKRRLTILEIGVGGFDDPLAGGGSLR